MKSRAAWRWRRRRRTDLLVRRVVAGTDPVCRGDVQGPRGRAQVTSGRFVHARIECKGSNRSEGDAGKIRMARVEDNVRLFMHNRRRNLHSHMSHSSEPAISECLRSGRCRHGIPSAGKCRYVWRKDIAVVRNIYCDQYLGRERPAANVHEFFKRGKGDSGSAIKCWHSNGIPATAEHRCTDARTVQCIFSLGDTPQPHAAPPVAMALSTWRTDMAPGSVSR